MKFHVGEEDPFRVLSSTKPIIEDLKFIKINEEKIKKISDATLDAVKKGIDFQEMHFGITDSLENDIQLIFLEDVVNFCFWEEKGKEKWKVEYPKGTITNGGWYTLTKAFQRALKEKIDILNSDYLINLNLKKIKHIFRGVNNIEIPLIEDRLKNLREAGIVLNKKYSGQLVNALEEADFDAVKITKLLYEEFPSFRDVSILNGKEVIFLKRAQICSQDFSYLGQVYKKMKIRNIDKLSAFADYKIPQMLRMFGIISYSKDLADKVDNYILIPQNSREEIEIRAVTIWCIEMIRQRLEKYTAADIDNALWLLSQGQKNIKPYHRTYSIYY